jgi:hypothetical protein
LKDGIANVLNGKLKLSSCYATAVVQDPSNSTRVYVVDDDSDGGICVLSINPITNELYDEGRVLAWSNPIVLAFYSSGINESLAVIIELNGEATLMNWDTKAVLSTLVVFVTTTRGGDGDAMVHAARLTPDLKYLMVLDNNPFGSGGGTMRFAAVRLSDTSITTAVVIDGINDPSDVIASPFNNAALISSTESNALVLLSYDSSASPPFRDLGPIAVVGAKPQLPTNLLPLNGEVNGLVLVAELSGVRQVQFMPSGVVEDLGLSQTGAATSDVIGCLGVQFAH